MLGLKLAGTKPDEWFRGYEKSGGGRIRAII